MLRMHTDCVCSVLGRDQGPKVVSGSWGYYRRMKSTARAPKQTRRQHSGTALGSCLHLIERVGDVVGNEVVVCKKSGLPLNLVDNSTPRTIHTANYISYESYDQELSNKRTFACTNDQGPEFYPEPTVFAKTGPSVQVNREIRWP